MFFVYSDTCTIAKYTYDWENPFGIRKAFSPCHYSYLFFLYSYCFIILFYLLIFFVYSDTCKIAKYTYDWQNPVGIGEKPSKDINRVLRLKTQSAERGCC